MHRIPDLESLQLLLQIAGTGSLTKAAARCGLGQPSASARLRAMERQVGTPLVERTSRGSRLTGAGGLVADWARQMIDSAAILDAGLASLQAGQGRGLTIASSKTVAEHLVPRWLAGLARRHPSATFRLEAMNSVDVPSALAEQSADLGFVEGPEHSPTLNDCEVSNDELLLVVAPSHRWARRPGRTVSHRELLHTRLVQRDPGSAPRQVLEEALRGADTADGAPATPLAEFSTNHAVVEAVAAGWGPAVLSDLAVEAELAAGTLVEVRIAGVNLHRRIRAIWSNDRELPPLAAELVELAAREHRRCPRGPRRVA